MVLIKIENSGPLLHMMIMRFEAKHNFSKRRSHIICNFKNIAFSLASRHQLSHAFVWMTRCPLKGISDVGNGTIISSSDIRHKSLILPLIGEKIDVFMAEKVVILVKSTKLRCLYFTLLVMKVNRHLLKLNKYMFIKM